jgi:hypothetical protein
MKAYTKKWGLLTGALGDPTTRITRGSDPLSVYAYYIGKPNAKLTNVPFLKRKPP